MSTFESLAFFRGVSKDNPTDRPYVKKTRKDREPRNSSLRFHNIANQWFIDKFGVSYRSQAVFVTSGRLSASSYAESDVHLVRIIPISVYRYCWSRVISDLYFVAQEYKDASEEDIKRHLDTLEYREDDLQSAHTSGHEVMIFCDEYISIPVQPEISTQEADKPFILLPGKY